MVLLNDLHSRVVGCVYFALGHFSGAATDGPGVQDSRRVLHSGGQGVALFWSPLQVQDGPVRLSQQRILSHFPPLLRRCQSGKHLCRPFIDLAQIFVNLS